MELTYEYYIVLQYVPYGNNFHYEAYTFLNDKPYLLARVVEAAVKRLASTAGIPQNTIAVHSVATQSYPKGSAVTESLDINWGTL